MVFADRVDGGRQLANELRARGPWTDAVVLGIPRGGVVVAAEVARELDLPLGIAPAAKVGAPGNPEFAIGSVAADGEVAANPAAGYSSDEVRKHSGAAHAKVERVLARFGGVPDVKDRPVIVVDDGLATGLTAIAAVDWLKRLGAARVILAIPVSSVSALATLKRHADEVISLDTPVDFFAVGQFYRHFDQTEDDEVEALLNSYAHRGD